MIQAVKSKISTYLSPIFEKKKKDEGHRSENSPVDVTYGKRSINQVGSSSDLFRIESRLQTPTKKTKLTPITSPIQIRSPLKLFDGWNWGGIFDKGSTESIEKLVTMTEAESSGSDSRKILTATRKKEYRVPLSQISNTTLLDLTTCDDEDDELQVTNVSIDLTKPTTMTSLHSKKDHDSTKVVVDLTDTSKTKNRQSNITGQLPTNLIGSLSRHKSAGFLCESVRLDEKTRYKNLLAHYTNVHLPEYSESISPRNSQIRESNADDAVTTVSSTSWFGKKANVGKPVVVDLTDSDDTTIEAPRRKFFHELLSHSKSTASIYNSFGEKSSLPTSTALSLDGSSLHDMSNILETRNKNNESRRKADISILLDTDWIQKWRDTIDPRKLEREKQISEEEKRKEALKRRQKEEYEALQKKIEETAKVSEFIELTTEMRRQVKKALGPGSARDVFVEGFNAEITRADLATLRPSTWLNDEVVNFYFNLLKERGEKEESLPNVHIFNTFFYPKIVKMGHAGVKRWTRKIDIFSYDLILIPVHLGMHWCMAVIDLKGKEIVYYDSLRGNNPQCLTALKKYMDDESKDKKKTPYNFDGWAERMPKNIPEQMNGCDCGVFACKYAEYRSRNAKFTFTQSNMPYFRERMVYEIINKNLM